MESIHPQPQEVTQARIEYVRRLIRREYRKIVWLPLSARTLYIYGALICDDIGKITHEQLEPPYAQDAIDATDGLLVEFNLVGMVN